MVSGRVMAEPTTAVAPGRGPGVPPEGHWPSTSTGIVKRRRWTGGGQETVRMLAVCSVAVEGGCDGIGSGAFGARRPRVAMSARTGS